MLRFPYRLFTQIEDIGSVSISPYWWWLLCIIVTGYAPGYHGQTRISLCRCDDDAVDAD